MSDYQRRHIDCLFQDCVDQICALTGWGIGHVYIPDQGSNVELLSTPIWHLEHPKKFEMLRQVTKALRFTVGVGMPGHVLATGDPVWVSDIREHPDFFPLRRLALDLGLQAAFAFPVKSGTIMIAVLEFFSETAQAPKALWLETIERMTSELGSRLAQIRAQKEVSFK